jgi:hypothetical protein
MLLPTDVTHVRTRTTDRWLIGTRKKFAGVPFQLRLCVLYGTLYGIVSIACSHHIRRQNANVHQLLGLFPFLLPIPVLRYTHFPCWCSSTTFRVANAPQKNGTHTPHTYLYIIHVVLYEIYVVLSSFSPLLPCSSCSDCTDISY